jgi:MFS transporter, FHS family, Na+ dependent glucose transporter 1
MEDWNLADKTRAAQTAAYFIAFVALGLGMAALGPTLPGLAHQTHVSIGGISYLFTLRSFGFLLGSLFSGRFYDRLPGHRVMATMILAMSATMALLPLTASLPVLLAVMLALGTAEGALGVGGNALLVWIFQRRVPPYMNALHFFYGVGGLISPLIVAKAFDLKGDTGFSYFVFALLILPSAAFLLTLKSPVNPSASESSSSSASTEKDAPAPPGSNAKVLLLIALFLGLYVGAEVSYGGWIDFYIVRTKMGDENLGAYLTSVFWASLTAGRLLGVPIAARLRPRTILLADLIGCFISLAVALIWPLNIGALIVASIGIGLSMASIYPTGLTFAERRMKITGQVTGFLIVGGSAGGMVVPLIVGQLFDSKGPRVLMLTILADLAAALGVYLWLISHPARERADSNNAVRA